MQIGPVRWIFIKSPTPRKPYSQIRKVYEVELSYLKAKHLSELKKQEILALREKTKVILKAKRRAEMMQSTIALGILVVGATLLVYFLIK